jgi:putative salt-induced outer membrane protein YdiY
MPLSRACLAALLLFVTSAAQASIVNIESQRGEVKEGFSGRFHLALGGAAGNTDKINLQTGARLEWKRDATIDLSILEYNYGETNDVRDTNRAFAHLRRTVQYRERRAVEGFVQVERNEFTRLSFRGLAGGGLRLTLSRSEDFRAYLGLGAFAVREVLDDRVDVTDAGARNFVRGNLYLSLNGDLNDYTTLYNTLYYQPALDDLPDARVLNEAGLRIQLSRQIDLRSSVQVVHQSRPPQTVDKTDITYLTGIEYRF